MIRKVKCGMRKVVFSMLVDNTSGVLSRISGLFSRRGYNISSSPDATIVIRVIRESAVVPAVILSIL